MVTDAADVEDIQQIDEVNDMSEKFILIKAHEKKSNNNQRFFITRFDIRISKLKISNNKQFFLK